MSLLPALADALFPPTTPGGLPCGIALGDPIDGPSVPAWCTGKGDDKRFGSLPITGDPFVWELACEATATFGRVEQFVVTLRLHPDVYNHPSAHEKHVFDDVAALMTTRWGKHQSKAKKEMLWHVDGRLAGSASLRKDGGNYPAVWIICSLAPGVNLEPPKPGNASALSRRLASELFPAPDVEALLAEPSLSVPNVLAGVRAEGGPEAYLDAAQALLEIIDWEAWTPQAPLPAYRMIGAVGGFQAFQRERPCDHLGIEELNWLLEHAPVRDRALALDIVRAIELGDRAAFARILDRLGQSASPLPFIFASGSLIGAERLYEMLAPLAGDSLADRLRVFARSSGVSTAVADGALAVLARQHGVDLGEELPYGQYSAGVQARLWARLALAMDRALGQQVLAELDSGWHRNDVERFVDLPWDEGTDWYDEGGYVALRRLGSAVLKARGSMEPKPAVREFRKAGRVSVKLHDDDKKAARDFAKAVAALPAGIPPPRRTGAALDEQLWNLVSGESRELAARLLAWGANPNHRQPGLDEPALVRAAGGFDAAEMVRLLLAAGADPQATTNGGYSALDAASTNQSFSALRAAEQLVAAGTRCRPTALLRAAELGHHRLVPLLIRAGADPDAKNSDGHTALELARKAKNPRTARAIADLAGGS